MTEYTLEYKGVICIGADWENDEFDLVYKGKTYRFKQKRYISQSADTDHIRCVINQFLEDVPPITQFDRIKAMSIDEMAEFMFRMVDCVSCQNKLMNNGDFRGTKKCNDKDFYAMCNGDGRKCLEVCKAWLENEVSE